MDDTLTLEQLKTQLNDLNNQIQAKQNEINSMNNSFNAERDNFNNQIQAKQNEINSMNNSFASERNSFNSQIETQKAIANKLEADKNELNRLIQEGNISNSTLNFEINTLKKQIGSIQESSNEDIISKLSDEYKHISEVELSKVKGKWLKKVNIAFLLLLLSITLNIVIFIFTKLSLSQKIAFSAVDILAATFLWFSVNQYSYYSKLYTDYSNRKIVSTSYLGVLNNIKNKEIHDQATKIVVETLFSRSSTEVGSELPIKEITKIVSSLIVKEK